MTEGSPVPGENPVQDRHKYDELRAWFFSQTYRPFIREAKEYARTTLALHVSTNKLRKYINQVGPPEGAKPQLWKSQSQEAGSKKGQGFERQLALGTVAPRRPTGDNLSSSKTSWRRSTVWKDHATYSEPPSCTAPTEASNKTHEEAATAWDMLCRDGWVDSKKQRYPPSCDLVAKSRPARKVEATGDVGLWRNREPTLTDMAGLLLQATGVPAERSCKTCLLGKSPWIGCIVSAEDGPAASKYNKSCANCWYGGRANDCEFRSEKNLKHHRNSTNRVNSKDTAPRKRRHHDAFGAEHSSPGHRNDENSYAMVASDILPKRLRHSENQHKMDAPPPRPEKGLNQDIRAELDDEPAGASEDEEVVARPRERVRQRQMPSEGTSSTPSQLGLGQDPPLHLADVGMYLDHYIRHYQHRTLGQLSESRALRKLEITAIDLVLAKRK